MCKIRAQPCGVRRRREKPPPASSASDANHQTRVDCTHAVAGVRDKNWYRRKGFSSFGWAKQHVSMYESAASGWDDRNRGLLEILVFPLRNYILKSCHFQTMQIEEDSIKADQSLSSTASDRHSKPDPPLSRGLRSEGFANVINKLSPTQVTHFDKLSVATGNTGEQATFDRLPTFN